MKPHNKVRICLIVFLTIICCVINACQPTPEDAIVSQKGDLTDKIAETADPSQAPTGVGSHYSCLLYTSRCV